MASKRDYRHEYDTYQKHKSSYRSKLNKKNREDGTYGNGDGLDKSHQKDGSLKDEKSSKNKGRIEKSRKKGSKRKPFASWKKSKNTKKK
tara:strand:- start:358 stop:624 length:267 start_codon:yes stop_codon:yes gene_type:complete